METSVTDLITLKRLAQLMDSVDWQKKYCSIRQQVKRGKYKTYQKIKGEGYISIDDEEIPIQVKLKLNSNPEALCEQEKTSLVSADPKPLNIQNELSPKQYEYALAASKLINLFIDHSALPENAGNKVKAQERFINAYNNQAFEDIYKIIGPRDIQTIRRWRTKYLDANKDYRVLAPQYRLSKPSSVTPEEAKILVRLFLDPKQPLYAEVIREACNLFEAQRLPNIKSYSTYKRFLEQFKNENYAEYVFAREGEKGLDDKILPYIERDYDKVEVGDIIVMDGHVNNYEIINPLTGLPKRMITIGAMDFKSQYLAGYEIAITENTLSIASALRRAILQLGKIPKIVYIDNGKAFSSEYFHGNEIDNTESLFKRLGIKVIFAKAYHAQSKPIEPFWGWLAELERKIPTYSGTSIASKPARMNRGEKLHMKLYQKAMLNTTIDFWAAHNAMAWWLDEYHNREKVDGHLRGLTPAQVFNAGRGPGVNKEELVFLMLQQTVSTLYRKGIHMFSKWYWNEAIFGQKLVKDELIVRYDILDHSSVYIYDTDGNFICEAFADAKVHPAAGLLGSAEDKEELQQQLRRKESLKSAIVGDARKFLQEEIYPDIHRQLKEANIISIPENVTEVNTENSTTNKGDKKKKRSLTDLWNDPKQKPNRNSDIIPKSDVG